MACHQNQHGKRSEYMDREKASELVRAWANHRGVTEEGLRSYDSGGFRGQVGAAEFEYEPSRCCLIVRGCILEFAQGYANDPQYTTEVKRMVEADPDLPKGMIFEVDKYYETFGEQPRLNFRIEVTDNGITEGQFIKLVGDVVREAFLWNREKLDPITDTLNLKRRQK
jgi:hypothetical protein